MQLSWALLVGKIGSCLLTRAESTRPAKYAPYSISASRRFLPQPSNAIGVEDPFVADDRYVFRLRLSDQHTIKGVFVGTGQKASPNAMRCGNCHPLEPFAFDLFGEVRHQISSRRQFAQANFRRDFPSRSRAYDQCVPGFRNRFSSSPGEPRIVRKPPQQRMGIEQCAQGKLLPLG
jgi:hypothetical protein